MEKYLKEEIAFMQLTAAIELFNEKKYVPSITLASAAEELLSAFLAHYSMQKKVPILNRAEIDQALFEFSKGLLGIDDYISYRNRVRNELKHHGEHNNKDYVKADFRSIALMHISGAISNFKLRTNRLPKHKIMIDFCKSQGIS